MNNKRQIKNFRQNFNPIQGVFILVKRGELIYNFQGNRVLNTQYHTLQIAEPVIDMEMNNKYPSLFDLLHIKMELSDLTSYFSGFYSSIHCKIINVYRYCLLFLTVNGRYNCITIARSFYDHALCKYVKWM